MYGFWKNKRIVLFDTLIEQCSQDEVVAVLAHELGAYLHAFLIWILSFTFILRLHGLPGQDRPGQDWAGQDRTGQGALIGLCVQCKSSLQIPTVFCACAAAPPSSQARAQWNRIKIVGLSWPGAWHGICWQVAASLTLLHLCTLLCRHLYIGSIAVPVQEKGALGYARQQSHCHPHCSLLTSKS